MIYNLYCRLYQGIMRGASGFLNWHEPEVLEGIGAVKTIGKKAQDLNIGTVLIVTDRGLMRLGLLEPMLQSLQDDGIRTVIYDKTVPNPTLTNVKDAARIYQEKGCEGMIAFGGGSAMDCAKGVGVMLARPDKKLEQMEGVLKVRKAIPPFFAVPTTAGTGSECTIATVLTDEVKHRKFAISDLNLIPDFAVLDPELTIGLPRQITAETAMDALTHAVEAYIGGSNTKETRLYARSAVKKIFDALPQAYKDGGDLQARRTMQKAAYEAGLAFTRAYVGYVHAMAHQLGGYYHVPHGRANAIILPYVLEAFGDKVDVQLAELADLVGIGGNGSTVHSKAALFIQAIRDMNRSMGIPEKISELREKDIAELAKRATYEGNPLYPVAEIWKREDFEVVYRGMLAEG